MNPDLVVAVLGSGGVTAYLSHLATAKAVRAKLPAERDSIIAEGAHTAVQSLTESLAAETARANRSEQENAQLRQRCKLLEARLDSIQSALEAARAELHEIRESGSPQQ